MFNNSKYTTWYWQIINRAKENPKRNMLGKKHSEKTKKKMSETAFKLNQFSKKCSIDGILYNSYTSAAKEYGLCHSEAVRVRLDSKRWPTWVKLEHERFTND